MRNSRKRWTLATALRQQTALAAFGTLALHSDDLQHILDEAVRLCAQGAGVPFCKIAEHRPAHRDLAVRAAVGWRGAVIGVAVGADFSTPIGRAFVTGQPVICRDLREPHDFTLPAIYAENGIASTVNVIIEGGGVLEIDSTEAHAFGERDVVYLRGFANMCAATVQRLQRQRTLRQMVRDQGTFLRELQHRVRNHLLLLVAQAQLLANRTADAAAKHGFEEIVRRLMALATLYDQLLGVRMASRLDLGAYLLALANNIRAFETLAQRHVVLDCDVEPAEVPLDTATSLGIIVNELVANSLEHAFTDQGGRIDIVLRGLGHGRLRLVVADNGAGMPTGPKGLGLNLVRRLAHQLGGTLELKEAEGTRWEIVLSVG